MSETVSVEATRLLAGRDEEKLINAFFVLYKTARIIEQNNAAFQNQLANFYDLLTLHSETAGNTTFKIIADRFFINEMMVRFDDSGISGAASVVREWQLLGIGGVSFAQGVSRRDTADFFAFMSAVKPTDGDLESLVAKVKTHGLESIKLLSVKEVASSDACVNEEVRRQFRAVARGTFFQAVSLVQENVTNTVQNCDINISKTKRVVHSLIDQIIRDESSLLELAAIKDFDDYTFAHSTNVAVYALTLGVRLGLDRSRLSHLGFTALFHDIGKVKLPIDLISKPDAFDENDWVQMQRHPNLGTKTILRNLKLDVHTARAARGAFEHHINSDFTGYPMLHYQRRPPCLFSRIISIVDSFDALTSGRVYLKKQLSPDLVFKKLRYQMKVKFDPFLLKLFNNIIGIYPAGSLVLLTTDEIALILTNNEADRARPYVKIVGNRQGLLDDPLWVDLSQAEHADRKIVRLVDPGRYGLDIKDFILQD